MMQSLALIPERTSFVIAERVKTHPGLKLVIVKALSEKEALLEEVKFFYPGEVYDFSDWETLPYDPFSPHIDLTSERLKLLAQLPHLKEGIIFIGAATLLSPLPSPTFIKQALFSIQTGQKLDLKKEREALISAGYQQVDTVFSRGEYSVRGSIFDLFPMGSKTPYRLDLFGDTVDSIRAFNPETQLSLSPIQKIDILPTHEFPLDEASTHRFIENFEKKKGPLPTSFTNLKKGLPIQGLEYYLPLFFNEKPHFFSYLPPNTEIILQEALEATWNDLWTEIEKRYTEKQYDSDRPPLLPADLFHRKDFLFAHMKAFPQLKLLRQLPKTGAAYLQDPGLPLPPFNLALPSGEEDLQGFVAQHACDKLIFTAQTEGRTQLLSEHLKRLGIHQVPEIAPLQKGWIAPLLAHPADKKNLKTTNTALAYIPEASLFPGKSFAGLRPKKEKEEPTSFLAFNDFSELKIGDIVVHIHHGIGRYAGLSSLDLQGNTQEFLTLHYQNEDKLYVPIQDLGLLSRYSMGELHSVALHQLGSDKWQRSKEKAAQRITDIAAELLQLYAERLSKPGISFQVQQAEYQAFKEAFPYEETEDQTKAIQDVIQDLQSDHPMDRLLCGDVGFGKTEVAMRAAFIAAQNGKQVVILVPTTLLAEQHYDSFVNRFAKFPIKIAHFSRFTSPKQELETRKGIESGQIDIVIATHKIIRSQPVFKDLGLIVVDEEHRFGVKDKEKLKSLKNNVDILTMTATPIPRTLNLSLATLRDLSIIGTPPKKRLAVKTFVKESSQNIIKEAILREVMRGGQVYYLHNEVASIHTTRETLQNLLPELSFRVAHGQQAQTELEAVMSDFYHNRAQVLICSTIIETGLDIPNANTIIIDRADKLGLAQLHQLRGRVGRSHHQAYAYLLAPSKELLTSDAKKRLEALEKSTELGSGFTLASHDLEIRGAGEILGAGQSGHMQEIGFSLYHELLDRAIQHCKKGSPLHYKDLLIQENSQVELNVPRRFPEDYIDDVQTRLALYQKLQKINTEQDWLDFKIEVIDRFGPLPEPALFLLQSQQLKLKAQALGIQKIEAHASQIKFEFSSSPHFDPLKLIQLVQTHSHCMQLRGQTQLIIKKSLPKASDRFEGVHWILKALGGPA